MLMWVLAVVLVGGFAALGFQLGGVRSVVTFVGALLGLALAGLLGGLLAPLLPKLGVVSQAWLLILPAISGFGLVWLISLGASFAVHRPVELHFKYREDDTTRQAFERMNQAIGMFVGMLTGVILLFAVGKPIYGKGYLTTQLGSENEPAPLGYLNSIRVGMAQTGWDRTFAPLDRTPSKFYAVADVLGLIYANPALTNRLVDYPPFLKLAESQDVIDMLGDPEYMKLFQDQAGLTAILNHAKTQGLLNNGEFVDTVSKVELSDLQKFLETGKSPKYDDERLLGRWRVDMAAIVTDARRKRVNLALADLKNLRMVLNALLGQASLTVYPEGQFALRVPPPVLPAAPAATEAAAAAAAAAPAGSPYLDPALAQRYGLRPGGAPAATAPAATGPNTAEQFQAIVAKLFADAAKSGGPKFDGEGTWVRSGDRYTLKFTGSDVTREAVLQENGRFMIPLPELKLTLVFVRAD
jgi:hypothetical protein